MNLEKPEEITRALHLVDREIWVVTAATADGRRGGSVVTSVWVDLLDAEHPRLAVGITPSHFTAELLAASETFAVHLLRSDQAAMAWNFASGSGRDRDKLAGLATNTSARGTPILANCLAWLECRCSGSYQAMDRVFYTGDILAGEQVASGQPLRENGFIASLTDSQRRELAAAKAADLELVKSRREPG